jgi:hypothetical protein
VRVTCFSWSVVVGAGRGMGLLEVFRGWWNTVLSEGERKTFVSIF